MNGSQTVGVWLRDRARLTPDRTAIDFDGDRTTYRQLNERSMALAAELARSGVGHGDRVAILADNDPDYVAWFFACARSGAIVTPLNWRLATPELAYQLDHSGARVLVASGERTGQARAASGTSTTRPAILPLNITAPPAEDPDVEVADDDPLFLIYTSGTTGRPKGAILTHSNCFWTNLSIDRVMDVTTFDVVLQILPQFHVGGWNVQPLLAWWKGATVILERSFDPGRALRLIESKRVTTMMGVPATYMFMAEHPDFTHTDLSSLRMAVVGGAPLPETMIGTWSDRGVNLVQGYGLSEASPNVLGLAPEYVAAKPGYAGKAYPHTEVALVDANDNILEGPATGELVVRGPNVFAGYWNDPDATAQALRNGWLHTGDVAARDEDGFYRIRDRVKDMYISGGENVYPAEVESVLMAHPAVVEAAVVGIPDRRWGEVGAAFVALRTATNPDELIDWCAERLAKFKVPRTVTVVDALPRSGMNKVLKRELLDRYEVSS